MTDEQRPDLQWAPLEPRQNARGRVWLIVGLAVAALAIVGALLFFLLPRDTTVEPGPTPSPTTSPAPTSPGTASPPPTDDAPTPTPSALNPTAQLIDDQLQSALGDLDDVGGAPADLAQSITDQLLDSAQRMSDSLAGSGSDDAYTALGAYSEALQHLQTSIREGADRSGDLSAARDAIDELRAALRR